MILGLPATSTIIEDISINYYQHLIKIILHKWWP